MSNKAQPQPKHGGPRPGSGRPKLTEPHIKYSLYFTAAEREQIRAQGGTKWARALILQALADAKH